VSSRSSQHEPPPSGPSTSVSRIEPADAHPLPPLRDRLHLVVDFFRHIHPIPAYAFLYEEATVQRCLEETIDEALIYSICALSALLLGYSKYHPVATATWATRVENMIWASLEQPTIFKIQALALVIQYRIITGKFQRGFLVFSLAARSATALRLSYERTDLSPLAQEIRRRLMWSLVMLDGHFAIGLSECELCPFETIHLRLPGPEETFDADHVSDVVPPSVGLDGVEEGGLLAISIQQVKIRRDLLRLKREIQLATQPVAQIKDVVRDFTSTLQQLRPQPYSIRELHRFARSRWVSRYIAVHLSWHQCLCDAYRLFLTGYKESAPEVVVGALPATFVADAVAACLFHARANISILHDVDKLNPRLQVADTDLAICGYHASRLLLHISRSSQNPPVDGITFPEALELAQSTLRIIQNLQSSTYAIVQVLIKELDGVIQSAITGQDQGSRESSDIDEDTGDQRPRYARVAKQRQGLGAHSIFRQARFLDDSALAAQRSGVRSSAGDNPPTAVGQLQMDAGFQWQAPSANPPGFLAGLGNFEPEAGPGEAMTLLPQGVFDAGPFGPDPWAPWQQDGAGMDDWVMQSDGNYF
jgi:hypothetical protein